MASSPRSWNFVKSNLLRVYDVDLLGLFFRIFHNTVRPSCGRPRCVLPPFAETCSSSSSIPITQSPPSPLSTPPPRSRLRVLFFMSCVMSIYLSIDLSVHFLPGLLEDACCCCWVRLLYRCCCILASTSQPKVYWLEEVVRPATQRLPPLPRLKFFQNYINNVFGQLFHDRASDLWNATLPTLLL